MYRVQSGRGPNSQLLAILSHGVMDGVTSFWTHYVMIHRVLPTREAHLSLWCSVFFQGSLTYCVCGCLLVFSHSQRKDYFYSSVLPEVRTDIAWLKVLVIHHIIRLFSHSQSSQANKDTLSNRTFRRPRDLPKSRTKPRLLYWQGQISYYIVQNGVLKEREG